MQNKFFGSKLNSILLLILIVLMIVAIHFILENKEMYLGVFQKQTPVLNVVDKTQPLLETKDGILGNKDDLISFSISPYTKTHGVISYRGVIKGGYFFEGNILVGIVDANKKTLLQSNAVATTDWATIAPVSFEGNIDFTSLPKGPAYIQIHNDNASGLPANDKFVLIPIIIN